MIQNLWSDFTLWLSQVQHLLLKTWNHLTPMQYGSMLVCIGVVGWLLMKSDTKRS